MLSLISGSLAGLYDATSRAERAAQRIIAATGQASAALDAEAWHNGARAYGAAAARSGGGQPLQRPFLPPATDTDLIQGLVDLRLAAHAYKAGAAVVRTADEMADALLDIKR